MRDKYNKFPGGNQPSNTKPVGLIPGQNQFLPTRPDLTNPSIDPFADPFTRDVLYNRRTPARSPTPPPPAVEWQDKVFAATIDTEGEKKKLTFTLDKAGSRITGSFSLAGVGSGNITNGTASNGKVRLECVFTKDAPGLEGETRVGLKRVLDGYFLYTNSETVDKDNDGKDDATGSRLPLLLGGDWVVPKTGTRFKLEPIVPSTNTPSNNKNEKDGKHWADLEKAVMAALPSAMKKAGKVVNVADVKANVPIVVRACRDAGVVEAGQIAYIVVTAGWESLMGMDGWMTERPGELFGSQTIENYFEEKYGHQTKKGKSLGNTQPGDGYTYRGRGFVQLTGKANYATWKKRLEDEKFKIDGVFPDLVKNPDLVATNKVLAAKILVEGMRDGLFVPAQGPIGRYINDKEQDFVGARNLVNPGDAASKAPMARGAAELAGALEDTSEEKAKPLELSEANSAEKLSMRRRGMGAWGEEIGEVNGVKAYFNAGDGGNKGRHKITDGSGNTYEYGLKWQCVEFIRRYYFDALKHAFLSKGHARDYFNSSVKDGDTNPERGLKQYKNGGVTKPAIHDLIVFDRHNSNDEVGHVAIVVGVSDTTITIAQQNVGILFTQSYALEQDENGAWFVDTGKSQRTQQPNAGALGWLRK